MNFKTYIFLLVILITLSCSYETPENSQIANNANSQNTDLIANEEENLVEGDILILEDTGETAAYDCKGREAEIGGTANTINLTGECKKLTVTGVSNKVTVEKVGEIIVEGNSNRVTYGEGLDGKEPKIKKGGVTPKVEKKKDAEAANSNT